MPLTDAMEENVFECVGWSGGKLVSNGDGYFYKVSDRLSDGFARLRCRWSHCVGKASLRVVGAEKTLKVTMPHSGNCQQDREFPLVVQLRHKILERCRKENTKLSVIFNEESNK